ncbi:MAG: hypothetical protein COB38_08495 [Gammaproteobacteria bacterium]|nr:MAG: hypothetical protein COB38_08495 [Gammaproteobacteria bacterium]
MNKQKKEFYEYDWIDHLSFCHAIFGKTTEPKRHLSNANADSYLFEIPENLGDGTIEFLTFGENITVIVLNGTWHKDLTYKVSAGDRIRMNFSLEYGATVDMGLGEYIDTTIPNWRIFNPANKSSLETIFAETQTVWVTLAFNKNYLQDLTKSKKTIDNSTVKKLLIRSKHEPFITELPLDHRMNLITGQLISMNMDDALRLPYAEAKINELSCVAIDCLLHQRSAKSLPIKLKDTDKVAIKQVKEIIISRLSDLPSVKEICSMIGVNRNKLHYGFKHIFNMSISQFINEERLALAYTLLTETDNYIIDIALEVGFRHQSSFSTCFRKKYGFPPTQLRSNEKV